MSGSRAPRRNPVHLRLYPEEILGAFFFCLLLVLSWKYGTPIKGPTVVVRSVTNAFLIIFGLALISGRFDLSLLKIVRNWVPIVIALAGIAIAAAARIRETYGRNVTGE